MRYAFIKVNAPHYPVRQMCHVMAVHPSGYYALQGDSVSAKQKEDQRLSGLIKQSWLESGGIATAKLPMTCTTLVSIAARTASNRELAINAFLMAVWHRQPMQEVIVHSDQVSQFSSYDWRDFLKAHNLIGSMSRLGNCYDNAVVESFFQLLKRERIKRRIYSYREEARSDVFNYIEMFYNPKRRHGYNNRLSPVEFERLESV